MIEAPKPLILLTADKDAQSAMTALLGRHADLGIQQIEFDYFSHPRHDSGVLKQAHEFLRPFLKWGYALVVFDREGCGREHDPPEALQTAVEDKLAANGWKDRARALVIDPELESWVWDASCQVNRILDWPGGVSGLQRWVFESGLLMQGQVKPARPKEAFDAALRRRNIKRSSALFRELATNLNFRDCTDPAFQRLISTLQAWFPIPGREQRIAHSP